MGDNTLRGAKISLLSNSQIRYEGYLCGLDQTENTVSLQNVRIFGTEGRKNGVEEVAASPQLYELIVFRGSDIFDLTLYESAQAPGSVDPAILSATTGSATGVQISTAVLGGAGGHKVMPNIMSQSQTQTQQQQPRQQPQQHQPQPQPARSFYDDATMRHAGGGGANHSHNRPQQQQQQQQRGGGGGGRGNYHRRGGGGGGGYGGRGRGGGHYRRRNQDGHTGMEFTPAADNMREEFKEEFDFDRARREFEKNKKEFEEAKEEARHHNKVYDRTSFFDNISGDQKDRGATRMDRDQMKKADTETFGSDMVGRMNAGGMRRGGRGGRGHFNRY